MTGFIKYFDAQQRKLQTALEDSYSLELSALLSWQISGKLNKVVPPKAGSFIHHNCTRSPNLIANWFIAELQHLIGIVHFFAMFSRAK